MYEAAKGDLGYETEQPQHSQDDSNGPKHLSSPSKWPNLVLALADIDAGRALVLEAEHVSGCRFMAIAGIQLFQDTVNVVLYRAVFNVELVRDFLIAHTLAEKTEYFLLARGQVAKAAHLGLRSRPHLGAHAGQLSQARHQLGRNGG